MKRKIIKNIESETAKNPLYFITNQYNLREILSGGFIGSCFSYDDKYYEDLLSLSLGRIPLVSAPIDKRLLDRVNIHDPETSFAVILQIDQSKIDIKACDVLQEDAQNKNSKTLSIAVSSAIHFKHVSAIHFLTQDNCNEFSVRSYSDMPNPKELYVITPSLVADSPTKIDIIQWLKSLPQITAPPPNIYSVLDKISGAVCLCAYYSKNEDQRKQLLKLVELTRTKKTNDIPSWFKLGLQPKTKDEISSLTDIDEIVFTSTIAILHSYNLNRVNQRMEILNAVKTVVYSNSLQEDSRQILEKSFSKIERLLKLEDEFEPFKSSTKHDSLRGLLLFLLRPGHNELLSWNVSETNAGTNAMLTALAYAGIVAGRKGIEIKYRPIEIESAIADLVVALLNNGTVKKGQNGRKASSKSETSKSNKNIKQGTLMLPNTETSVQKNTNEGIDWKIIKEEMAKGVVNSPVLVDSAIRLSIEMGWDDCVSTVIKFAKKGKFIMEFGESGEINLRVSGFPLITQELNVQQFSNNINKFDNLDKIDNEFDVASS